MNSKIIDEVLRQLHVAFPTKKIKLVKKLLADLNEFRIFYALHVDDIDTRQGIDLESWLDVVWIHSFTSDAMVDELVDIFTKIMNK